MGRFLRRKMNTIINPVTQKALWMEVASPQTSFGVRDERFDHVLLFTMDTEWFYKFCNFKKRCKRALKGLGCGSCRFGLLSPAMESVLTVVNRTTPDLNEKATRKWQKQNLISERFYLLDVWKTTLISWLFINEKVFTETVIITQCYLEKLFLKKFEY